MFVSFSSLMSLYASIFVQLFTSEPMSYLTGTVVILLVIALCKSIVR